MASFHRILSLSYAFQNLKKTTCFSSVLGISNSLNKLIQTQTRCLFIKKSVEDKEGEAEIKKQHDLFQLNYFPKYADKDTVKLNKVPPKQAWSDILHIIKTLQDDPFHQEPGRPNLLNMIKLYKQLRFSPDFSTKIDTLKKSEEFEKFAQALEKSLPMASVKCLYLMFQAMDYCQIPYSSILMQKLHALILDNINKFELLEIIEMYLLIKNKNEILLEPLKTAFTAHMKHLTFDSLKFSGDLKNLAYYASNKEVPISVREKILKKILSLQFQLAQLEPVILVWLSEPLCSKDFQFFDKTHFLNALKKTMSSFKFKDLYVVLKNICNGIRSRAINYDKNMCDIIANCATKYDLRPASIVMNNLLRIGHVNYGLADAIAAKVTESSLSSAQMQEIINIFGAIHYKNYLNKSSPETWLELEKILKDFITPEIDFKSLETPLYLFILELDTKEVITKALNKFFKVLESNKEVSNTSLKYARLLYQCHCAVYSSPIENVPKEILPDITQLPSFNWKEAAYNTFNGEEYVLENGITPFGILTSFMVIMGPDLKPISLSSYKKPQCNNSDSFNNFIDIESISRPPRSKVFAFIECNKESIKFRNVPLLKLEPRIINKIHKNLGYRIIHLYTNHKINSVDEFTNILTNIIKKINIEPTETESSAAETT